MWAFYLVWLAAFAHGWARPGVAWREQAWAIAAAAAAAVLLNAVTTSDHPARALATGQWGVAGVDLMLLASATVAVLAARALGRRRRAAPFGDSRMPAPAE